MVVPHDALLADAGILAALLYGSRREVSRAEALGEFSRENDESGRFLFFWKSSRSS